MTDPTVDEQAVADMLSFGNVLGEKTLVEEVQSLPPATILRHDDETTTVEQYWQPTFGRRPTEGYVGQTADNYRGMLSNVADTVDGDAGLWLSGGLDSRTMARVLREEFGRFQTFTYDHNSPDGSNLEPARRTAEHLGIGNEFVEIRPGAFGDLVETGVEITDGMTSWIYFVNPDFTLNDLHGKVDVIFEGAPQGELFGEHVWLDHLERAETATEAVTLMLRNHREDSDTVSDLLDADIDPDLSIRRETTKSDIRDPIHRTMDVWFRNFCSNAHFRAKRLTRSQVGTRIPFSDGPFLDHLAQMPHGEYRREAFPLTGGKIPRSMSPLKRDLICEVDSRLADIPYERTGVAPSQSLVAHDAGYVANQLRGVVGSTRMPWTEWSRDHPRTHEAINEWLESARDREVFDGDEIRRVQREHMSGDANHIRLLASVTTLELWMDSHLS